MTKFPILVIYKTVAKLTFFHLNIRKKGDFILSEQLLIHLKESNLVLPVFLTYASKYNISCLKWQLDWSKKEQEKLKTELNVEQDCFIDGDSWTLPLFLALDCATENIIWPNNFIASGAIRRTRGVRCCAISRAIYKIRFAQNCNYYCFLPKANCTNLKKRGIDTTKLIEMPQNIHQCINIWRCCCKQNLK